MNLDKRYPDNEDLVLGCISCEEDRDPDEPTDPDEFLCPKSQRPCGHHCNHSWSHEECCWCGKVFGDEEVSNG